MENKLDQLFNLENKRSNVALLSLIMLCTSFASLVSGLFVVNRRCWVIPCAHRHRGNHGELLGLKVRSGDSLSALVTSVAALTFAWWNVRLFFVESEQQLTSTKFVYLRGFSIGLSIMLFQASYLWWEESGTVGTFVHRGAQHINSPGMTATIPNVPLLHAMQALSFFTSLTFILGSVITYCLFKFKNVLLPNNEYQEVPSASPGTAHDGVSRVRYEQELTYQDPTTDSDSDNRERKSKHGKKKRNKKTQSSSHSHNSSNPDEANMFDL